MSLSTPKSLLQGSHSVLPGRFLKLFISHSNAIILYPFGLNILFSFACLYKKLLNQGCLSCHTLKERVCVTPMNAVNAITAGVTVQLIVLEIILCCDTKDPWLYHADDGTDQ